ncbi:hypothetical protein [Saccharothrix variisporea]|uniref:hypothetical protein n=1 Tax=Saccharothrix variisporea TaxID=543527 RepID=UPI000EAFF3BD|nr:hypothetical protein [Saccharothrix variisporea]
MTQRLILPVWSAALALLVLFPLLGRGFVLSYDMVFAPHHSLLPDSLGMGTTPPRSVPADAVVALLTTVLPGDLVQKLLLAAALTLGPLGAGRLVPTDSTATRLVAATTYGWTPYIAERLFMGHWPYLLAYACLPWIASAGLDLRTRNSLARLVLWAAPAALTPTGGLLAAGTALAASGWRKAHLVTPALLVLNLPWLVPSLLRSTSVLSAPQAVDLFAAKGENWAGAVVAVLSSGGFWNADVVPASRTLPLVPVLTLALVAAALLSFPVLIRKTPGLVPLGVVGLVFALLAHLPFGETALEWAVSTVPGTALLRDAQKWVAWWALPLAIGFALTVEAASRRGYHRLVPAVATALPLIAMPDLAWAGWGRLDTVQYPADWAEVREFLADDQRPGDVLALPLGAFRRFEWNDNRTQLDPAPRVLPRTTVVDDTVYVDGTPVPGEDTRLPAIREALRDNDLGRTGIGWVLVEHGTPGELPDTSHLTEVFRGPWLTLYRVPGDITAATTTAPTATIAGNLAALALLAGCLLWQRLPTGRLWFHRREE